MKRVHRYLISPLLTATLLVACALLPAGCSDDDRRATDGEPVTAGEPVQVKLRLNLTKPEQPSPETKATGTDTTVPADGDAPGGRVIASQRTDGVLLELVETPEPPATRAADNPVKDVWVFQFDGSSNSSLLSKKLHITNYTGDETLELLAGTNQRIAVFVNTDSDDFMDTRYTVNSSTYASVLNDGKTRVISNLSLWNFTIGSGTVVADLSTQGIEVDVEVRYNLAQVSFFVRNGTLPAMTTAGWKAQVCSVPDHTYLMPHRPESGTFPDGGSFIDYLAVDLSGLNTQTFVQVNGTAYYVPVNRRGTVAGTTAYQRKANAPAGATYLKIWGETDNGSVNLRTYTYTIPLGGNFTDDYNLKPNHAYTYRMTLFDSLNDSQLEVEDKLNPLYEYVGMFGGELKNGQFTKPLYVEKTTPFILKWWDNSMSVSGGELSRSTYDGRTNTFNLSYDGQDRFPAANACYRRAGNPIAPGMGGELVWYLPAMDQLMAIYAAEASFSSGFVTSGNPLWSSTANDAVTHAAYVSLQEGLVDYNEIVYSLAVRCVRER